MMSKKSYASDAGDANETAEATLLALTTQIHQFVVARTLDSRCATKLVKRLRKEADAVSESGNATKTDWKALEKAFEAVDAALREHDAGLLVTANAALRATDATAKESKGRRSTQ
jgi:hypothetical protein